MYLQVTESSYTVTVNRTEILAFCDRWPCSNLPDAAVWFEFDRRSGDLVDTSIDEVCDGAAALALSHDAQDYATPLIDEMDGF